MSVRLTPHQKWALELLRRYSGSSNRWVDVDRIGSAGAMARLVLKGVAEVEERRGPRGGYHYFYRPTTAYCERCGCNVERRCACAKDCPDHPGGADAERART